MVRFAFLILNYKSSNETIECVKCIENLDKKGRDVQVVIVDNDSQDESMEIFEQLYQKRKDIHLIQNNENAGFSRGNNCGYDYICEKLAPDFLIMINSDIECRQRDFLCEIEKIYDEEKFMVLGPDVYAYHMKIHQSPICSGLPDIDRQRAELQEQERTLSKYKKEYANGRKYAKLNNKKAIEERIYLIGQRLGLNALKRNSLSYRKRYQNVAVHGSAIIFSRLYMEKYKHALYPEPFYYGEEDLLFLKCLRENDKIVYDPRIKVWHSAGASATRAQGKRYTLTREIFRYENLVKTRKLLIQVMQDKNYFEKDIRKQGKAV